MSSDIVSLVIASISLLVAGLSLGWQIGQWLLSGGRPKATLLHGVQGRGGVFTGPVEKAGRSRNVEDLRKQGFYGPEVVGVQVTNHGRASVAVESVALCSRGGGISYVPNGDLIGPQLPYRLDAGTNETWFVDAELGRSLVAVSRNALQKPTQGVYMTVTLGTGKTIETPTTLRI